MLMGQQTRRVWQWRWLAHLSSDATRPAPCRPPPKTCCRAAVQQAQLTRSTALHNSTAPAHHDAVVVVDGEDLGVLDGGQRVGHHAAAGRGGVAQAGRGWRELWQVRLG